MKILGVNGEKWGLNQELGVFNLQPHMSKISQSIMHWTVRIKENNEIRALSHWRGLEGLNPDPNLDLNEVNPDLNLNQEQGEPVILHHSIQQKGQLKPIMMESEGEVF